ncbi:MAG: hypothetical protein HPY52_09880 [Firmicutes bacterium]|nr:hypothetical protein [Bacillota bacterium]
MSQALEGLQQRLAELQSELENTTGGQDLDRLITDNEKAISGLNRAEQDARARESAVREKLEMLGKKVASLDSGIRRSREVLDDVRQRLRDGLAESGFACLEEAREDGTGSEIRPHYI